MAEISRLRATDALTMILLVALRLLRLSVVLMALSLENHRVDIRGWDTEGKVLRWARELVGLVWLLIHILIVNIKLVSTPIAI